MRRWGASVFLALIIGGWGLLPPAVVAQEAQQSEAADYGGLPDGPGREAVYFTCTACHSQQQFTQQRMERGDWDAAIERMVKSNGMAAPEPWARTLMLNYLATHYGVEEEDWAGLPPGAGREEVFYTCQACHSLKTVLQQRLYRKVWDDTLQWMIEEQGMPEPEPEEYAKILDYLGTHLSPESAN